MESELGTLRQGDVSSLVDDVVGRATQVEGARLVASLQDADADELRELAQKAVGRLESDGGAAVVLGSGRDGKALMVAACSKRILDRGVTAPKLLEVAAEQIGGGAGGKPILGFAGGRNADAVAEAINGIPGRLSELLAGNWSSARVLGPAAPWVSISEMRGSAWRSPTTIVVSRCRSARSTPELPRT